MKKGWITKTPQILALSFLVLILLGGVLLLLPGASHEGLSFTDAFFTATSAVCVTGLIVKDTGSAFTGLGQGFILALIQLGGLGIMTFTSFFDHFFRGESSFENRLFATNIVHNKNLRDVFRIVQKIILITLFIELVGMICIWVSLPAMPTRERMYFSIFHSVSAFCNAGFSTLSNSLYEDGVRGNHTLHTSLAFLFILGGIGFPILFNTLRYQAYLAKYYYQRWVKKIRHPRKKNILNLNTRIVLITTLILLIGGTILFFFLEQQNTLSDLSFMQQWAVAFFEAATPRTAGFNNVDFSMMGAPAILLTIGLMWIGASPGSTGGGVKTTTIAVACLDVVSIAQQKGRVEIGRRWVRESSVKRAFAVIFVSILLIGSATFLLSIIEPNLGLRDIFFECVSAYSTVGLSLGITAKLSITGKWIIILLMYAGRVGTLTILFSLFKTANTFHYKYPEEGILIN